MNKSIGLMTHILFFSSQGIHYKNIVYSYFESGFIEGLTDYLPIELTLALKLNWQPKL